MGLHFVSDNDEDKILKRAQWTQQSKIQVSLPEIKHNTDPVLKLFPTQLIGVMNKTEISGTVLT